MVMQMLSHRLCQLDCAIRGYVLHGFPLNRDQAELMMANGHKPNRVFFLNIPEDSVKERLALKRVDPLSGERYGGILEGKIMSFNGEIFLVVTEIRGSQV